MRVLSLPDALAERTLPPGRSALRWASHQPTIR
jgi:hypothetical protein